MTCGLTSYDVFNYTSYDVEDTSYDVFPDPQTNSSHGDRTQKDRAVKSAVNVVITRLNQKLRQLLGRARPGYRAPAIPPGQLRLWRYSDSRASVAAG